MSLEEIYYYFSTFHYNNIDIFIYYINIYNSDNLKSNVTKKQFNKKYGSYEKCL